MEMRTVTTVVLVPAIVALAGGVRAEQTTI